MPPLVATSDWVGFALEMSASPPSPNRISATSRVTSLMGSSSPSWLAVRLDLDHLDVLAQTVGDGARRRPGIDELTRQVPGVRIVDRGHPVLGVTVGDLEDRVG